MSQVTATKTLDLKSTKPQPSIKKKAKDDEFRKELDEKEKKTSDRDQLSAAHHNDLEKRQPIKKDAEASQNALRDKANETKAKSANEKIKSPAAEGTAQAKASGEVAGQVVTGEVAEQKAIPTPDSTTAVQVLTAVENAKAAELASGTTVVEVNAEQMEALQNMQAALAATKDGISLEGMTLMNPQAMQPNALTPGVSAETPAAMTTIATELSAAMSELAGVGGQALEGDKKDSEGDLGNLSSDQLGDALNSALQAHGKKDSGFDATLKAATADAAAGLTGAGRETNVDNLVQSARTLMRNGGGEMQIILNPEGLGAIDLKVAVKGDQVSIEVIAQDNNVKKMFEDGMGEIRGALELQNLKIDHFKVDVSQQADAKSFAEQQQQENANREFARDFMNQFRGERQGMRQQSIGYEMERSPNFSKGPEGLSPAQNTIGANSRLNIVA